MSKIEWTDRTWNLVTGCTKISPGCKNCYAERMTRRLKAMGQEKYAAGFDEVVCHPGILQDPLKWCKPAKIFVCSMSDLFHKDVPFTFILEALVVMAAAGENGHIFQILTKRPDIAVEFFEWWDGDLPSNVWFGTTVENQGQEWRITELMKIPAKVRFLSIEPIVGPVSLRWLNAFPENHPYTAQSSGNSTNEYSGLKKLDWVIVGGESGPGARPCHPDWIKTIRDQCEAAAVPFMFKQWGEWAPNCLCDTQKPHQTTKRPSPGNRGCMFKCGKKRSGNLLDGKQHLEFPNE